MVVGEQASASDRSGVSASLIRGYLALVVLLTFAAAHAARYAWYTIDDAFITFRYARHLANGLGAVFNPGTYVKGYSNTLLMWLTVAPEWLGWSSATFVKVVGFAALFSLVVITFFECRRHYGGLVAALGAPALIAASASISLWYVAGLETGLYTTLVFGAVTRRLREVEAGGPPYSAGLFVAVVLSRPEGVIFFVAMALHGLVFHPRRASLRNVVWHLVPLAALCGELLVSKAYYGAALPSTFYAKVDAKGSPLGSLTQVVMATWAQVFAAKSYFAAGLAPFGGRIVLFSALLAFLAPDHRPRHLAYLLCLSAQVAFVARVGGDWMAGYRFVVPALPFVFMLTTGAIVAVAQRAFSRHARRASVLGLLGFALFCAVGNLDLDTRLIQPSVDASGHLAKGETFAAVLPLGATFASFDVGGEGYAAPELEVIDLGSLTDDLTHGCLVHSDRCSGYATALAPELVARHPKRKAAYFYLELLQTGNYVQLGRKRSYLARRDLLLAKKAPPSANVIPVSASTGTDVVAAELPRYLRPGTRRQVVLYWTVAVPGALPSANRALAFVRSKQSADARASAPWWSALGAPVRRLDQALVVDRLKMSAPTEPGTYEVVLGVGTTRQSLGRVEVVGDRGRAEQLAKQLVDDSGGPQTDGGGEAALRTAVALGAYVPAHTLYERRVISRARHLVERSRGKKIATALRHLDEARGLLHRAYMDMGHASTALRRSIDEVGKVRRDVILTALGRTKS